MCLSAKKEPNDFRQTKKPQIHLNRIFRISSEVFQCSPEVERVVGTLVTAKKVVAGDVTIIAKNMLFWASTEKRRL